MRKLIIMGVCISLVGCLPAPESEFWRVPAPAVPGGGGGAPAPIAPRPVPNEPLAPPMNPIMQDPEGQQTTISDYVWATDEAEAIRLCRNLAERWGNEYSHVQRANNWTNKAGKSRWTCFMTNYGEPRYGDPNDNY